MPRQTRPEDAADVLRRLADKIEEDPDLIVFDLEASVYRRITRKLVEEREDALRKGYRKDIDSPMSVSIKYDGKSL